MGGGDGAAGVEEHPGAEAVQRRKVDFVQALLKSLPAGLQVRKRERQVVLDAAELSHV